MNEPLALDQPLPLAVFPDPCIYRESAITALNKADRAWRLAFESSSMAGCLSAASSGFAVTVIADSQRVEGLRLLGRKEGLPALPVVRFYAVPRSDSPACADLIDAARSAGQQGRFSPRALRG